MQTSLAKTDLEEHPPLRALRSKADGGKGLQDGSLGDFPKVGKFEVLDIFVGTFLCFFFFLLGIFQNVHLLKMT